jgi:hypothetical protein
MPWAKGIGVMRIFLILAAVLLILGAGLYAFNIYYWTHVSAHGPDSLSATEQPA